MNFRFIFLVATRYFLAPKSNRLISIISTFSLLGVTIGVAALIVVMSVMNGFHIELTSNIRGLNSDIMVNVTSNEVEADSYQSLLGEISKKPYVTSASPIITGQALATTNYRSYGVIIKAMPPEDLKYKDKIKTELTQGDLQSFKDGNNVLIGVGLARNLSIGLGDTIRLMNANVVTTMFGSMPRYKDFVVGGIFSSGIYDYDNISVIMNLEMGQKFFSMEGYINLIEIYTRDFRKANEYSQDLRKTLIHTDDVNSWQNNNSQFLSALAVERTAMFLILSLIIIVAAFNIISSLFMFVKDKTRDIAILRTIGASRGQILFIFIMNGSIIGIIGSLCGASLGLLIASNLNNIKIFLETYLNIKLFEPAIYFLYHLPSDVQNEDVIFVCTMSLTLSVLATIYPAYKAANLNPVEAIRYE
jgi:lipoprotein-releasing system permease protein